MTASKKGFSSRSYLVVNKCLYKTLHVQSSDVIVKWLTVFLVGTSDPRILRVLCNCRLAHTISRLS
jgi:hypothetical protein